MVHEAAIKVVARYTIVHCSEGGTGEGREAIQQRYKVSCWLKFGLE